MEIPKELERILWATLPSNATMADPKAEDNTGQEPGEEDISSEPKER